MSLFCSHKPTTASVMSDFAEKVEELRNVAIDNRQEAERQQRIADEAIKCRDAAHAEANLADITADRIQSAWMPKDL